MLGAVDTHHIYPECSSYLSIRRHRKLGTAVPDHIDHAEADAQSRMFHENTEWDLNQQVFEQLLNNLVGLSGH